MLDDKVERKFPKGTRKRDNPHAKNTFGVLSATSIEVDSDSASIQS